MGEDGLEVALAIVPSTREEDDRFPYITSRTVDTQSARALADAYDARWGIEASYRVMKGAGPWTTSNAYAVRLPYHLLMVVVYNLWVLANRLLQPGDFNERRLFRMEDFLERLPEAVRFRRKRAAVVAQASRRSRRGVAGRDLRGIPWPRDPSIVEAATPGVPPQEVPRPHRCR